MSVLRQFCRGKGCQYSGNSAEVKGCQYSGNSAEVKDVSTQGYAGKSLLHRVLASYPLSEEIRFIGTNSKFRKSESEFVR